MQLLPRDPLLPAPTLAGLALLPLALACSEPEVPGADGLAVRAEFEAVALALEEQENPFLYRGRTAELEQRLARPNLEDERRARVWTRLVQTRLALNEVDEALEQARAALAWAREPGAGRAEHEAPFLRLLALCHLRRAEVENCVRNERPACCIFPLAGGGIHETREPARAALDLYLEALAHDPEDLELRWLANLAAMAIDEHPEALPERWRIEPSVFDSEAPFPRFENVGREAGVDAFDLCGGVAIADFDGDGHLDLVTSSYEPRTPLKLFLGGPGLVFREATSGTGLEHQLGGLNVISADYDSDGDPDLLVLRGAWLFDHGAIRNSLLRNEGDGTWSDVTVASGIDRAAPTQAACFADFDGDGHLDLYVANESRLEIGPPVGDYPAELWINRGDGTFVDRAREAGVTNDRYAKGVSAGDFDDDGDMDLYVSNVGANRLYRNDGTGHFVDVAPELGVTGPEGRSFAPWWFDQDGDGRLDLFVAAFEARLEDVVRATLGLPHAGALPRLYRNEGGRFRDVAPVLGLDRPWLPMGANFGDLDGDGWLDLFLATGEPDYEMLVPNVVLRNDGGRRFLDVTTAGGFGHLQKGHGVALADLDDDGDVDVFNQLGGFYPGDGFRNALFENPGFPGRFLQVELRGTRSNRDAIGARLQVEVELPGGLHRTLHRAVGSVSSFGGSPLRQDLGLGQARAVVDVRVAWPGTPPDQAVSYGPVPLDSRLLLVEGQPAAEVRSLR